jgi:signal transduction histidine kinase
MRIPHPPRQDVLTACAVAAYGQLDVWAPGLTRANLVGPRPVIAICYLATAAALAFRRVNPLAVVLVVCAVDTVQFLTLGASEGQGTLLPALVAVYSVAAHCERRTALVGGLLAGAVMALHGVTDPQNRDLKNILDAVPWNLTVVVAWLLGAYMRARRLYVAQLEERAQWAEQEREERARAAVAAERARLARELHDVIAHGVSLMVLQAEAAEELLARDDPGAKRAMGRVQTAGRQALGELERLLGLLRTGVEDAALTPQPGVDALPALVAQVREAGIDVSLAVDGERLALAPSVDHSVYRIAQEALTNVLKHADAGHASVRLSYRGGALELVVTDDGAGAATANGGHGLAGMRERVTVYGGTLAAGPTGDGWQVRATLPAS